MVAVRTAFDVVIVVGPSDCSTVARSDSGTSPVAVGIDRFFSASIVAGGFASAMYTSSVASSISTLPVSRGDTAAATSPPTWVSVSPRSAAACRSTFTARYGSAAEVVARRPRRPVDRPHLLEDLLRSGLQLGLGRGGAVTSTSMSLDPPNPLLEVSDTSPAPSIRSMRFRASDWMVVWSRCASVVTLYCTEADAPPPNAAWIDWPLEPIVVWTVCTPGTSRSARSTSRLRPTARRGSSTA